MRKRRSYFRTCSRCGAHLDPGERCDCQDKEKPAEAATPTDFKAEQKNELPVSASIITNQRKERK